MSILFKKPKFAGSTGSTWMYLPSIGKRFFAVALEITPGTPGTPGKFKEIDHLAAIGQPVAYKELRI